MHITDEKGGESIEPMPSSMQSHIYICMAQFSFILTKMASQVRDILIKQT